MCVFKYTFMSIYIRTVHQQTETRSCSAGIPLAPLHRPMLLGVGESRENCSALQVAHRPPVQASELLAQGQVV